MNQQLRQIDEKINPVVVKEMRQAMRSGAFPSLLLSLLGLLVLIVVTTTLRHSGNYVDQMVGRSLFTNLTYVLTIMLISAAAPFGFLCTLLRGIGWLCCTAVPVLVVLMFLYGAALSKIDGRGQYATPATPSHKTEYQDYINWRSMRDDELAHAQRQP